jgi:hypothetical protein
VGSLNRKGQQYRPPKDLLQRMVTEGLLTDKQRQKLIKGNAV